MGALFFISLGLMLLLAIPGVTYFHAKHLGRRPWLWFFISLLLPGIATVILSILPDLSEDNKTKDAV
jgi:hypothetical protein